MIHRTDQYQQQQKHAAAAASVAMFYLLARYLMCCGWTELSVTPPLFLFFESGCFRRATITERTQTQLIALSAVSFSSQGPLITPTLSP